MLMSIRSAPFSATIAAASRITSGSCPNSWMATGCSSGWMRRNSRWVRSSPYFSPKLETISETASPAPWRLACSRTNQLPIPASGASRTRLARRTPPISKGSLSAGWRPGVSPVALMDQSQSLQGQQVVDLVDRLGEGDDGGGVAAGGEEVRVGKFVFDPADHAVDQAGEAVDEAGVDRRAGGAADRFGRLFEVHPGDPRRP